MVQQTDDIDELDAIVAALYENESYHEAIEPALRSVTLARRLFGERSPRFAKSLNNLALLYAATGSYGAAEKIYQQVIEIDRVALGEKSSEHANGLSNLGTLCYLMGDYATAELLLEQSIGISKSSLGEHHPNYATTLNAIAMLYGALGQYAIAESFYKECIEIRRQVFGEQHPIYAQTIDNLAALYCASGNYLAAQPLCKQAVDILRSVGEDRLEFATSLSNFATLCCRMGDYSSAAAMYKQAIEINRIVLGEQHPQYAMSLNNLALCYAAMGIYSDAEQLYKHAIQIKRNALGGEHPSLATSLQNLASVLVAEGKEVEARDVMEECVAINDRIIGQVFSITSERQRTAYLETARSDLDIYLSLVSQHLSDFAKAVHCVWSSVLRRKGIELEALAAQRDTILTEDYAEEVASVFRRLKVLRSRIAQKTLAGPEQETVEEHQQLLAEWNVRRERMEMLLARYIPEVSLQHNLSSINHQVVGSALPAGTVLIEYVQFNSFDFTARPAHGESYWKPARYVCFVTLSEKPDSVEMIDLGEAEPIDRMITTLRETITGERESNRGPGIVQRELAGPLNLCDGTALRAALFDPLLNAIGDHKRLFLAPDGDLTRLPFEVLPAGDGRRLIDDYQINYLGTGRDVLRFGRVRRRQPAEPFVAADPNFDLSICEPYQGPSSRLNHGYSGLHFRRLPGTREEGKRIAEMLNVEPHLFDEALKSRLKAHPSPWILHLATHGFFLSDQRCPGNKNRRDFLAVDWHPSGSPEPLKGPGMNNALLRSGLALAGANTFIGNGGLPVEAEDGILTAEDVSGLNLFATELVVLSACETGLGQVRTGEGVFGLRRAFVVAGAKTLVMSLWKVPDQQTQQLMEGFYERVLSGQARAEALREAQLEMEKKYPDPFYWGAFICEGDPGPLNFNRTPFDDTYKESLDFVLWRRIEQVLLIGPIRKCGGCGIESLKHLVLVNDKKRNSGYLCQLCVGKYGRLFKPASIRNFWLFGLFGYRVLAGTEIDATVDSSNNECPNCGLDVVISLVNLEGDCPVDRGLIGEPMP